MEFLFSDWLGTPVWFWAAFIGLVVALTAFDLGILHKENKEMGIGESLKLSALYIGIALAFGAWIWAEKGGEAGLQYYTGFFIEKALSIDNIFVISLIFATFAIPARYQYRALLWGIVAVIVLRGIMIAGGAALVTEYEWLLYVFAAFLVFTGVKMLFASDKPMDVAISMLEKNLLKLLLTREDLLPEVIPHEEAFESDVGHQIYCAIREHLQKEEIIDLKKLLDELDKGQADTVTGILENVKLAGKETQVLGECIKAYEDKKMAAREKEILAILDIVDDSITEDLENLKKIEELEAELMKIQKTKVLGGKL